MELLRRALENVIRNAVKYTAADTTVRVDMTSAGAGLVRIEVRDRGPGVPPDSLRRLFEPFYRADPARDRKSGGAGLGLAIAREGIERHGGAISARNLPEGGLAIEIEPRYVQVSIDRWEAFTGQKAIKVGATPS